MRLKVILSFLAICSALLMWEGVHAWNKQESKPVPASTPVQTSASHSAATPNQPFSTVKFSVKTADQDYEILDTEKKREVISILEKLPKEQVSAVKNIVLDYNPEAHRGLGGKGIIIIRAVDVDKEEFYSVMVHEIGHSVDLGFINELNQKNASEFRDGKNMIYETDQSLSFYRICWENEKTMKKSNGNQDFVSGYAMSDPFEDFAETYAYYVFHNKDFQNRAKTSDKLMEKYIFMKKTVFGGKVFDTGIDVTKSTKQPWDVTVLPYDFDSFLKA